MSKIKMKCPRCGKHFKSSNAKQALCPDCEARERHARAVAKATPVRPAQATPATPVAAPKIVGPGANILVPGMVPVPAEPAVETRHTPADTTASAQHEGAKRHVPAQAPAGRAGEGEKGHRPPPAAKAPKPPRAEKTPPKPREPRPQTPPFELTDELRGRIEARYLELAQPVEFDGIRGQIAAELSVPKPTVKRAVQELRTRMQLPSWWDLRAYSGSEEDLARIRAAYEPLLPVPEVGVHKRIATDLGLNPVVVYQGIRRIRAEMRLPQYNPPELHAGEQSAAAAKQTPAVEEASAAPTGPAANA
jgi:predicted  nucleic acid-binding Zn-ribbon protein